MYKITNILKLRKNKIIFKIVDLNTHKKIILTVPKHIKHSYIKIHFNIENIILLKPITISKSSEYVYNEIFYISNLNRNDGFFIDLNNIKNNKNLIIK